MVLPDIPLAQVEYASGSGAFPFILLLIFVSWVLFAVAVVWCLKRLVPPVGTGRRVVLAGLAGTALASLLFSSLFSPPSPVLCTYTGLAHITSSYRIAGLEWNWAFPTDYPLSVPALAAVFVKLLGQSPAAFSAANMMLAALGSAGTFLLGLSLFGSVSVALGAGLAAGSLPLLLLFAGGDGLSVGYFALGPWVFFFARWCLAGRDDPAGPTMPAWLGLSAALVLICQTRLEALAVPALLALFWVAHSRAASLRRNFLVLLKPGLVALVALLPYLSIFYAEFLAAGRMGEELGTRLVYKIPLVGLCVTVAVLVISHVAERQVESRRARLLLALPLFVLYCLLGVAYFSTAFLSPAPLCAGEGCTATTYASFFWWHINPKVVPVGMLLLLALGLLSFRGRREGKSVAFLVLWIAAVLAASSTKATGELPFEGARTQLPATAPFALLVGLGVREVGRWFKSPAARILIVLALALPLYPQCLANIAHLNYDQQAEFAFLRECSGRLEPRALVYAPDDVLEVTMLGDRHITSVDLYPLYRTGYLFEALGGGAPGLRMAGLSTLEPGESPEDRSRYFFLNLNCHRTGEERMTDSCAGALEGLELVPVCGATIENRPYTSDFYEETRIIGQTVRIAIYRILGSGRKLRGDDAVSRTGE
jgi:hypothetical protein